MTEERRGFTRIPNNIIDDERLTAQDARVYLQLAFLEKWGKCNPSLNYLTRKLKMGNRTLYKALKTLKDFGYIEIKRGYGFKETKLANTYYLRDPIYQSKTKSSLLAPEVAKQPVRAFKPKG